MKELVNLFDESPVRAVVIKGEPWFVLKDICDALGIANQGNVSARLEDDEKGIHLADTLGGKQEVTIINESGLYSVILRSDKPEAKRFKKWVTSEVLPAIRKTGRYSVSMEARKESAAARSALCRQWQEHGADKFYHYVNLTKNEYGFVFGDKTMKKADMTVEQLAILKVFESVEYLKLIKNEQINGYHELDESIRATAKVLPLFTTMSLEGARA